MLLQLCLLLLAGRLLFGRLKDEFLRTSTKKNAMVAFVLLLLMLGWFSGVFSQMIAVATVLAVSLVVAVILLNQVIWTLKHYKLRTLQVHLRLKELPTVTLAIPARNETHALTECLKAAVASDYPKLEILVLDDCSQDETSALIRSFAHDGVRFIQGNQPTKGWLGKNQALQMLAEQASGEYVLFAGVDTNFSPQSITQLVTYALSSNVTMVSVLPQRRENVHPGTLLPGLRYFWQIALPITKRRVAVATQCWLIKTDAMQQLGGFAAIKNKIVPEGWFARRLFGGNMYRFIISNTGLGITTAKRWSSQNESALRFLYPTFKRQPLYIFIGSLLLTCIVLGPFLLVAWLPGISGLSVWWWGTLGVCCLYMLSYALVTVRTHPHTWLFTTLLFPLSVMQEMVLLVMSMLLYEFGEVNWKGRNVCYPVINSVKNNHS